MIYKSPRCFIPSFKSISLSVQEKKRKIDFQDGHHCSHLGFLIRTILAIDLQVTLTLPIKFRVNWSFGSGEEAKRFSWWPTWRPSWISDQNDFSYFWSTGHSYASYQVSWPFGSREEEKNRFSRWLPFSIRKLLATYDLQVTRCFLPSFESIGLLVQKKRKIDFQDGSHHGSPIGTILAIFDLQATPMLATKFQVNWPRGVGGVGF